MPAASQASTKRQYASALKKYCVIAEFAPASILRLKFARSSLRASATAGDIPGYAATSMWNQSPVSSRMNATSSLA